MQVAINQFNYTIKDPLTVKDFPEELLKAMVKDVSQSDVGPWTVTLNPVVMKPFMGTGYDDSVLIIPNLFNVQKY